MRAISSTASRGFVDDTLNALHAERRLNPCGALRRQVARAAR